MKVNEKELLKALSSVMEPDLNKDVVTLGLVKDVQISSRKISFSIGVSNPALHSKKRMQEACEFAIERAFGSKYEVVCTVGGIESEDANLRRVLPGVKNIIAVASGKGGVGKSTIAANLALGLVQKGYSVGMIDTDVHGPSIPTMFDLVNAKPKVVEIEGKQYIEPVENYGVKLLSMGFFADPDQPIVWRGAMSTKALKQMFNDTWWGDLDFIILDLPPGTGDVHLSIVQSLPLTAAVIVSTPQEVALADARKGVAMFRLPTVNVPVLGIVENMAWFTPEELPDKKYYIFGKEGAKRLSDQLGVALLGQLPIIQSIRESGDVGRPAIMQDATESRKYLDIIIDNFLVQLEIRNKTLPATKKVEMKQ